jgi:hypothetical protein
MSHGNFGRRQAGAFDVDPANTLGIDSFIGTATVDFPSIFAQAPHSAQFRPIGGRSALTWP